MRYPKMNGEFVTFEQFLFSKVQVDTISDLLKSNENKISRIWWYCEREWPKNSPDTVLELVERIRDGEDVFASTGDKITFTP